MKRVILAIVLAAVVTVQPMWAGENHAGYPYPAPHHSAAPAQEGHPILRKLLIGGVLVGIGFVAGRLTAPKTSNYYPVPARPLPPYPGRHGVRYSHHGPHHPHSRW